MIYGLFKGIIQLIFEEREFQIPKKIQLLHENLDKLVAYTSFFTLIEITEQLEKWSIRKKMGLDKTQIQKLLDFFKDNFRIKTLKSVNVTDRTLDYVLNKIEWKDAIQLEIARNNGLVLITDDDKLRERGRKFHSNILTFKELVNKLEERNSNCF